MSPKYKTNQHWLHRWMPVDETGDLRQTTAPRDNTPLKDALEKGVGQAQENNKKKERPLCQFAFYYCENAMNKTKLEGKGLTSQCII